MVDIQIYNLLCARTYYCRCTKIRVAKYKGVFVLALAIVITLVTLLYCSIVV